jgi:hypothetical protein
MKILFFDVIQLSDAPSSLRSPALANRWEGSSLVITLNQPYEINCIGIGNTDARELTVTFNSIQLLDIEGNITSPSYIYEG